ncbi:MAG TPA: thiamine pyrophosphate-dependent enzyme [Candidatus Acidoferrales bacterium]|nr:thiamine pyrophosphate-dependent enzyme [Candidatus Acidoferrales bacterium]
MTENKAPAPVLIEKNRGNFGSPSQPAQLGPDQLRDLYYFLQLNRQIETRLERLFRQGKIVGGLYSSLGQEAISVGAAYALEAKDWLAPMIRNIGALLVKGVPPKDIFTQHMAREASPTRGRDATSHMADLKNRHIAAPTSMLGDLIPVLTGVAMAGRYLGQKIVALTFIGDGGTSTGAFHEGMNLAASQRAPLVVILENNQWAYSTPSSRQVPLRDFAERAKAYGILSSIVDGNDVLAVYNATKKAVDECRTGRGPRLLEAKTMRMKGHAQHDAADYVPKEMFEYWKARDPIDRYTKYLIERGLLDENQKSEIDARVERELDADQKFAEEAPFPKPESAAQGVYCEGCHTIEANWQRPKEEAMPPATTTQAAWKIADFGAFTKPLRAAPPDAKAQQNRPQHQHRQERNQQPRPQKPSEITPQETAPPSSGEETPLRVPFGRGPKDRSFAKEQPQQPANPRGQRGQRPPHQRRHDNRQHHGKGKR